MKKRLFLLLTLCSLLLLTSCEVNWFGETKEVPWYVVVIPVAVIMIAGYFILMRTTFVCPHCGGEFKPRPYELSVTLHLGRRRMVRCPHCGTRGFCKKKKSS